MLINAVWILRGIGSDTGCSVSMFIVFSFQFSYFTMVHGTWLLLRLIDIFEFGPVLNCIKRLKQLCIKQRRLLRRLCTNGVSGSYYPMVGGGNI